MRELEGIIPGQGMFARDRRYQKSLLAKSKREKAPEAAEEVKKAKKEDSDSECSEAEGDDETKRVLESGGRDKVAYFFWQGTHHSRMVRLMYFQSTQHILTNVYVYVSLQPSVLNSG